MGAEFIQLTALISGDPLIMRVSDISLVWQADTYVYSEKAGYERFKSVACRTPLRKERTTEVHVAASCSRLGEQRLSFKVREKLKEVRDLLGPVAKAGATNEEA